MNVRIVSKPTERTFTRGRLVEVVGGMDHPYAVIRTGLRGMVVADARDHHLFPGEASLNDVLIWLEDGGLWPSPQDDSGFYRMLPLVDQVVAAQPFTSFETIRAAANGGEFRDATLAARDPCLLISDEISSTVVAR
jgi:hypothetical protein